jgi:hypothetical protein
MYILDRRQHRRPWHNGGARGFAVIALQQRRQTGRETGGPGLQLSWASGGGACLGGWGRMGWRAYLRGEGGAHDGAAAEAHA